MREALDVDLYQLRMLIGFYKSGKHNSKGVMEAYVRKMPSHRRFLVACGIGRFLDYIKNLKITKEDINVFKNVLPDVEFTYNLEEYLLNLDFYKELNIKSMKEGEVFFSNEPVVQIYGPIGICQFVEKKLLSILNHDVRIASKVARIMLSSDNKPVYDFGGRRGSDSSAASIARSAYIGGCSGSSSVIGFSEYNVPCVGTMGHVWVMAHLGGEREAFSNWAKSFNDSVYLVDTYNSYNGIENAVKSTRGVQNAVIGGIRLDSGDLLEQSLVVKRKLIESDCVDSKIIASGDLNEYKIKGLIKKGTAIDAFGVGSELVSTPDSPNCGFVYKVVAMEDDSGNLNGVSKNSAQKASSAGAKQVYRKTDSHKGAFTHDLVTLKEEEFGGERLLAPAEISSIFEAREYFMSRIEKMPDYLKIIDKVDRLSDMFSVEISSKLAGLQKEVNNG